MTTLLTFAGLTGVAIGLGLLWASRALKALNTAVSFKAALYISGATIFTALIPWGLFLADSLLKRVVIAAVPTLAEEGAKAALALGLLSATRSALPLSAAALSAGLMYGTMESALIVSRCTPAPTALAEQLCALSVLMRPSGQAMMTFCTMVAVVHRRWIVLGLLVATHVLVNLTGLVKLKLKSSAISPGIVDFLYDAGRQVTMFVMAGLIALWLLRVIRRPGLG